MITMILVIVFGWVFALGISVYAVRPPAHLRRTEELRVTAISPSEQRLQLVGEDDVDEAA